MSYRNFKKWMLSEKTDIFGFDKETGYERSKPDDEMPIKQINLESLLNYLKMHNLGAKGPNVKFVNEIHWGQKSNGPRRPGVA